MIWSRDLIVSFFSKKRAQENNSRFCSDSRAWKAGDDFGDDSSVSTYTGSNLAASCNDEYRIGADWNVGQGCAKCVRGHPNRRREILFMLRCTMTPEHLRTVSRISKALMPMLSWKFLTSVLIRLKLKILSNLMLLYSGGSGSKEAEAIGSGAEVVRNFVKNGEIHRCVRRSLSMLTTLHGR